MESNAHCTLAESGILFGVLTPEVDDFSSLFCLTHLGNHKKSMQGHSPFSVPVSLCTSLVLDPVLISFCNLQLQRPNLVKDFLECTDSSPFVHRMWAAYCGWTFIRLWSSSFRLSYSLALVTLHQDKTCREVVNMCQMHYS